MSRYDDRPATPYQQAKSLGVSDSVIAGLDILMDDRMDPVKAAELLLAAERDGKDAETFARHLIRLRKAAGNG